MKNLFAFSAAVTFALALILSCSSESTSENTSSSNGSGNGSYGSQAAENGQVYRNKDGEKYASGSLTIYMADERDRNGQLILTEETTLLVGTMSNGEVLIALPENVDSRFLDKIDKAPSGVEVKPLGVEVLFYNDRLRLIDNSGKHIGNLRYYKINGTEFHSVYYWYFSENAKMNGITGKNEYKVDAKKGWNKVYTFMKLLADESFDSYFTTDLSEVPPGLKWLVEEFAD